MLGLVQVINFSPCFLQTAITVVIWAACAVYICHLRKIKSDCEQKKNALLYRAGEAAVFRKHGG